MDLALDNLHGWYAIKPNKPNQTKPAIMPRRLTTRGVVVNLLDFDIVVREFEFHLVLLRSLSD